MQTRLILGPAGSGKTFGCLAEIRAELAAAPEGPPLLLIAPKQTTYTLERQLLGHGSVRGYTRLHILSFDRLANFLFEKLQKPPPQLLDEEGRLMVLRSLLSKHRDRLKVFRASARLNGFAQQLSLALRELQRQQMTPESLAQMADEIPDAQGVGSKLHDLAALLGAYLEWLASRELQDADCLLDLATKTLRAPHEPLALERVWVDGFIDFSRQELELLAEVICRAKSSVITFCLDQIPNEKISWLSPWSVVRQGFLECRRHLGKLANCELITELLPRDPARGRSCDHAVLRHIEANWAEPKPYPGSPAIQNSLRAAICANPEEEATLAAHEILRFARAGGRYREVTVLTRDLSAYHDALVNVFSRYEIPFFLDRRESVAHHPLAELSRNALRTVALNWARDDWFAALKTGLVPVEEAAVDRLENEALARGWKAADWQQPIVISDAPELSRELEDLRRRIVPPFNRLAVDLGHQPDGARLAAGLRKFWETLNVTATLESWSTRETAPIHLTVWEQMNAWLENLERAFADEALHLRDWLPILEAGLGGLTAGVIPPALDQVLIGAVDRSRNPEIRLAIILGLNESVFPAPPQASVLLTDQDREELEKQGVTLATSRRQLSRERFHGYVAFTRARERLVLLGSEADAAGNVLNPSPFLAPFQKLFPQLEIESWRRPADWRRSERLGELIAPLFRNQSLAPEFRDPGLAALESLPALAPLWEELRHLTAGPAADALHPALAAQLYGPELRTSVSRMEQFAACPFQFFVHSGLRAEERKRFELDIRDQGNFQHEVLAEFHETLRREGRRWRDITPAESRERIRAIAAGLVVTFRDGLLQATEEGRFTARMMAESLQDFVETLVGWMRGQYSFDPAAVELPFGDADNNFPPWKLDLGGGRSLLLHGRIDRIDLCVEEGGGRAWCVVVDYKSSEKKLDALLMKHGLQLQLPAYLNVLRQWPDPQPRFGVASLVPAGVFYVNLRGKYEGGENRDEALRDSEGARKLAYRHSGRFDVSTLARLDQRPGATAGDQFNYRLKQDGSISANSREALAPTEFIALLDGVETALKTMGRAIYDGVAKVDPYRKGTVTACDQCDYLAICRLDRWTHQFRQLAKEGKE